MTPLEELLRRMGAIDFAPLSRTDGDDVVVIWSSRAAEVLPAIAVNLNTTDFEESNKEIRIGARGKELLILRKPLGYQP
jgi:hypothetical protein